MNRIIKLRCMCSVVLVAPLAFSIHVFAQFPGSSKRPQYPWSNARLSPDVRADMVLKELTLDEKIRLVHGLGWQVLFKAPESSPGTRAISAGGFIPGIPRFRQHPAILPWSPSQ